MRIQFAAVVLLALTGVLPVAAQTTIHRCIGANGSPVFTDQPCATLNATPATRSPAATPAAAPPAPVMLCAATASQLKRVVIEAFAGHDANRLAGVMLWGGYGAHAAVADIRALQLIMRRPLLGLTTEPPRDDDGISEGSVASAADQAPVPTALVIDTGGGDDPEGVQVLRFDVLQRAGCLWLRSSGAGTP